MRKEYYIIKDSITNVYGIINHDYFLMPNPSFLVNIQHIREIDGKNKKLVMENDDVILISRRRYGEDLFEDLFDLPFYDDSKVEKKLYGRHAKNLMKTDIKEMDNGYELIIDLPGFKKDEIKVSLDNGYLSIAAAKGLDQDEQEKDTGKYIRRERYAGSCERSFYVGEDITEEDIKGEFKHGILKLFVPKKEAKAAVPERKFIAIEG